jgi:ATP-dependent Lhr-like helicase
LYDYITAISRRSRFFNSVFLYEARKFGVISNDTDLSRMRFEKIVDAYSDSPLFSDTVRKFVFDYMDLGVLEGYLRKLISGAVRISLSDTFTESTEQFLTHYSERVAPLRPTKVILEAIKNRLLNDEVVLLCTSCGNVRTQKIKDIASIKCPNCGSYLVASLSSYEKNMMDKEKDPAEREKWRRRIVKNAHLVKERGIYAIMVLSGRGIGPETASRLLEIRHQNEDDLIRAILNSEMEYAKNRRFWD